MTEELRRRTRRKLWIFNEPQLENPGSTQLHKSESLTPHFWLSGAGPGDRLRSAPVHRGNSPVLTASSASAGDGAQPAGQARPPPPLYCLSMWWSCAAFKAENSVRRDDQDA